MNQSCLSHYVLFQEIGSILKKKKTICTLESDKIYFFLDELFLDIKSELREFEEVPTEELFSPESSVTMVMASCSCALAIDRVTTYGKRN